MWTQMLNIDLLSVSILHHEGNNNIKSRLFFEEVTTKFIGNKFEDQLIF